MATNGPGLTLNSFDNVIKGLVINSFPGPGIRIDGGANNKIQNNYLGTNIDGTIAMPNEFTGVLIVNSSDNLIGGIAGDTGNLISGNSPEEIRIDGSTATGNRVQGNLVGSDISGTKALGRSSTGILIQNSASQNIVGIDGDGNQDADERNLISGNSIGVRVFEASSNIVAGNWIGVDATGDASLPNTERGVLIDTDSSNNLVGTNGDGTNDAVERNVISGNKIGLRVSQRANSNTIAGNWIGLSASGSAAIPNTEHGVLIDLDAVSNLIGTNSDGFNDEVERNVISGNEIGLRLSQRANSNTVAGNWIGLSANGSAAIPNTEHGVLIDLDAFSNLVGTNGDGTNDELERNVISGNEIGLRLSTNANSNTVAGNWIGLSANGDAVVGNTNTGLLIDLEATSNLIGSNADGTGDEAERNVISGNFVGVRIRTEGTDSNRVSGNYIGSDPSGMVSFGNQRSGIELDDESAGTVIGTSNGSGLGNLISGNSLHGIHVESSSDNLIGGNYIGLAADGNSALGNGGRGVLVVGGATNNLIGTDDNGSFDEAERNVISGNTDQGVAIGGESSTANTVAGNYIGTSVAGTAAVPNESSGILLGSGTRGNTVGVGIGAFSGSVAGNLISGNEAHGIRLRNGATDNFVAGNFIGLDSSLSQPIPNGESGISSFEGAFFNQIGNSTTSHRNYIAGNNGWGIHIEANSGRSPIIGNWVGLTPDQEEIGNLAGGIHIEDANDVEVLENVIVGNGETGIAITGMSSKNLITRSRISGHTSLNIDLSLDGPTPNDPLDQDDGPNGLQNSPVISMVQSGASGQVAGYLKSSPGSVFFIQLFQSSGSDQADAEQFLKEVRISSNADGFAYWSTELTISPGVQVTALATGIAGVSEFSSARTSLPALDFEVETESVSENADRFSVTVSHGDAPTNSELLIRLNNLYPNQIQVPSSVRIPADAQSTTFDVFLLDDAIIEEDLQIEIVGTAEGIATGSFAFALEDDDVPQWHNPFLTVDVNGDRAVSPVDALIIINFINDNSERELTFRDPLTPSVFLDVNNDELVSPSDVLQVINFLNASNGGGEGEASSILGDANLTEQSADSFFSTYFGDIEETLRKRR